MVSDGLGWSGMGLDANNHEDNDDDILHQPTPHPTHTPGIPYKTLIGESVHAPDDQTRQTHLQCKGALLKSSLVEDKFAQNTKT